MFAAFWLVRPPYPVAVIVAYHGWFGQLLGSDEQSETSRLFPQAYSPRPSTRTTRQ